jgi:hypothetical protein
MTQFRLHLPFAFYRSRDEGLFPARADIPPELRRSSVFALRKESGGDRDGKESKMSLRIEDYRLIGDTHTAALVGAPRSP